MKVVETFEVVRKYLGWSYQEVSVKLGKYSPEYLRQVHQGRPFPGVEKDLILTYIRGLAERVVYLVFGDQIASVLREKLVTKFTLLIQQSKLSLSDVRALVEMISNDQVLMARIEHRTETMDAVGVEIDWEGELEDIIGKLKASKQGTLFESSEENIEDDAVLVQGRTTSVEHIFQKHQGLAMAQCPRCSYVQSEDRGCQCIRCGEGSIFNPNW